LAKKKKNSKPSETKPAELPQVVAEAYSDGPWWPSEFAPKRFAVMHAVLMVLLTVVLVLGVQTNSLLWFKTLLGHLIGMSNPSDLGPAPSSMDVAALLWCGVLVAGCALLHPSIGLLSLVTLRPWLDGYTFKGDNVYFLWGVVLILALWGVRAVLRGEGLRYPLLTAAAAVYPLWALLISPWSLDFAETYRSLLNWTVYVLVFVVTCQNLSSRRIQHFALLAIVLGMSAQAVFAVLQYFYVLPFLRDMIERDPTLLQRFFNVDTVTPEMARRFNINRAFGTVLFPNALAGFLILGLPLAFAMTVRAWGDWRLFHSVRAKLPKPSDPDRARRALLAAAVAVFLGSMLFAYVLLLFPSSYVSGTEAPPWYSTIVGSFVLSFLFGLLAAGPYAAYGFKHGLPVANRALRVLLLALSSLVMTWALLLTYSRGGMLALVLGVAAVLFLERLPDGVAQRLMRWVPRAAAVLLVAGLALFVVVSPAGVALESPEAFLGPLASLEDMVDNNGKPASGEDRQTAVKIRNADRVAVFS